MPPPVDNRRALPHNRAVDILGLRSIPFLVRPNFVRELRHLLFWSTLAGLVEGQFAAVVAAKVFNASEGLIAVATATPTAAN